MANVVTDFNVGQQVEVVGNTVNHFMSLMAGETRNSHAIAIGEVVTVLEISEATDEIKVDVANAEIEHPKANREFQWVDPEHIKAV